MNAISKKLLSLLVVLAMVLSMVPFGGLSIFAVETKAAETDTQATETVNPGAAGNAIDNSDEAIDAHIDAKTCPMCGATDITWTRYTNGVFGMNNQEGASVHAYYDSTVNTQSNLFQIVSTGGSVSKNTTVCVALKSTADITCSKYRIQISGTDDSNVLNIMGTGSVHAHQLEANGATSDLGLFQVEKGSVNLYGGKFTHTSWNTNFKTGAVIRILSAQATVNIYNGAVIGPDVQDTTNVAQNIQYAGAGTVNMYGGTIQNGVSPDYGYSGNVNIASKGIFKMYDGIIKNGSFLDAIVGNSYSNATMGGNVFVGGNGNETRTSASDWTMGTGYFYMYGGEITDGKANNGGHGGGNIFYKAGTMELMGGTISGGDAKTYGGNIEIAGNGATIKENVTISDGTAGNGGGNIYMNGAYTLNITGGEISGGTAKNGGNIYAANGKVIMTGGSVTGGTAPESGGHGGTLYLIGTAATETAAAKIGTLEISGDAVLGGGSAQFGDAIRMQPYSALIMDGGTINGQIQPTDAACKNQTASISVSGEAKITGTGLQCGQDGILLTDAGLTGTASIAVYSLNRPFVQYDDEAAATAAKGFYKASQTGYGVVVNSDGTLEIGEVEAEYDPDIFQPWEFDDAKAYCPVCKKDVTGWVALTTSHSTLVAEGGVHYYLADNLTKSGTQPFAAYNNTFNKDTIVDMSGCFNLNGYTLTMNGRLALTTTQTTLNIMDTSADHSGAITSDCAQEDSSGNYGHTIVVQGAGTINLYGGTYTNTKGTNAVIRVKNSVDAKVNIYEGAVIDGGNIGRGVQIDNGTVTLEGGTIQNGIATNGGNVYVVSGKNFVMKSGYIKDGKATNISSTGGGNIYSAGTVNLFGGEISGGQSSYAGGNIHVAGGTFTIGDGDAANLEVPEITVKDGKTGVVINENSPTQGWGGNIYATSGTLNIQNGALITDGNANTNPSLATKNYGGNISTTGSGITINVTGGTITKGVSYRGGNFDMNNGALVISGGIVSEGTSAATATYGGGNIYAQNNASVTIKEDAHLIDGTGFYGGSIRHTKGSLIIEGGIIEGGNASHSGGNIYASSADVSIKITGGTIKDGEAVNGGGNIYASSLKDLTVNGVVQVENGTAGTGGNIYATSIASTIELGGTWKGGTATQNHRANISLSGSNVRISGATIEGGEAKGQCGALGFYKCPTVTIENSTITGGTAGSNTGTLWIASNAGEVSALDSVVASQVTLTNCTVTAKDDKSAINVAGGCTMVIDGSTSVSGGEISVSNSNLKDDTTTEENEKELVALGKLVVNSTWTGTADLKLPAKYYCGDTLSADNITANGAFEGTLMNINGDNAKVMYKAEDGSLYLAGFAYVDVSGEEAVTTWTSLEDALKAADDSDTVYLLAGANVALNGETVYIDALKDIEVTGTGTAYAIDLANADFTTASTGKITGEIVENDATFGEVRYIRISDGTAHAIEMGITGVSLRPTAVGLYYKATYKCDATLAAAIDAYGVVLSVNDMPGDDFAEVSSDQFTVREDFSDLYAATTVANTVTANSGSVFGIMKESKSAADNAEHGKMKIYANAYILVDGAEIYVGDTENCGDQAGVALSLFDVMGMVDEQWDTLNLSQTNIDQINALFDKCVAWGKVDWTFTNIKGTNA